MNSQPSNRYIGHHPLLHHYCNFGESQDDYLQISRFSWTKIFYKFVSSFRNIVFLVHPNNYAANYFEGYQIIVIWNNQKFTRSIKLCVPLYGYKPKDYMEIIHLNGIDNFLSDFPSVEIYSMWGSLVKGVSRLARALGCFINQSFKIYLRKRPIFFSKWDVIWQGSSPSYR